MGFPRPQETNGLGLHAGREAAERSYSVAASHGHSGATHAFDGMRFRWNLPLQTVAKKSTERCHTMAIRTYRDSGNMHYWLGGE
jgi:hypothetical protein